MNKMTKICPIIEISELINIYKNPDVLIFDVSNGVSSKTNFETEHLEGAIFIDLNTHLADIKKDVAIGGRHPLPKIEHFAQTLSDFGISKDNHVVLYDDKNGANAAARFWWMLKSVGHEKVQVLNGGFQEAKKNNFPINASSKTYKKIRTPYPIQDWKLPLVNINEVESFSLNQNGIIVDVRERKRFDGLVEPIDLIAGHIPNAINIPFTENLDAQGKFHSPEFLKSKYESIFGETNKENIIIHCGSGVTACHTLLALDYANIELPNLYIGSWSEWSRNNKPIAKTNS